MYPIDQLLKWLPAVGVALVVALIVFNVVPGLGGLGGLGLGQASEEAVQLPMPAVDTPKASAGGSEVAVIAGGCFWGVQGVYQHVKGVTKAVSGYAGGEASTAHYEIVGTGRTGHAESVEVTFDPKQISYGEILRIFFSVVHDPTQVDRQGPDWGTQYRSNIFYTTPEQKKVADAYIAQLNAAKVFKSKIATKVDPITKFYAAEGYHQDYLTLHPDQPYIMFNDLPKVSNLQRLFGKEYQDKPVLVADAKQ